MCLCCQDTLKPRFPSWPSGGHLLTLGTGFLPGAPPSHLDSSASNGGAGEGESKSEALPAHPKPLLGPVVLSEKEHPQKNGNGRGNPPQGGLSRAVAHAVDSAGQAQQNIK